MKIFALERHDGGVEIMYLMDESSSPAKEIAKWHPTRQAEIKGFREIDEAQAADIKRRRQ